MCNKGKSAYLPCLYLYSIQEPLLACCFAEVTQIFLLSGDPEKRNDLARRMCHIKQVYNNPVH